MPKGQFNSPRGRKGLDGQRGTGESKRLTIRLSPDHLALLDEWRINMGAKSRSDVIRALIEANRPQRK